MLRDGFPLSMEAEGKTPSTIARYVGSSASFLNSAKARKLPDDAEQTTRFMVTTYLRGRWATATD